MLKKLSPAFLTGWQDRYIVLKDKKLKYYKSQNSRYASGVLNFDHFETTIEKTAKEPTKFKINISGVSNRTFEFKAATNEKAQEWYDLIFAHIKHSDGFKL